MEGFRQSALELLAWPFKAPTVLLLIVFALVTGLLVLFVRYSMGMFPLNLLLLAPAFYGVTGALALGAQLTFTRLALGLGTEARPGDADLNPFTSAQAFRHGVLLALALGVLLLDSPAALAAFALLHVILYLAVSLEDTLLGGLRPQFVARVVGGLNLSYLALAALLGGGALLLVEVLLHRSPALLGSAALAYLLCHGLAGRIVYLHRNRLELHTEQSPEQAQAAAQLAAAHAVDVLLEEAHRQCASGQLAKAVAAVDAFLDDNDYTLDPLLHERLRDFGDERLFLEHAVRYVERLAERGEHRKAWALVRECLDRDERFRPLSAQTLLATTQVAGREDARIVAELLADFESAYEDGELAAEALFRRARIHIELLRDGEIGLGLLRELEGNYPTFARGDRYRRYRARLRIQPSA